MILRQLTQASYTLACFESFLGQNGIIATQRWMKKMRPDICGDLHGEQRCIYTHHYSEVGQAFGFTCTEITGGYVPYPRHPTSAILMLAPAPVPEASPHSLLWTYTNNGVGFAMDPGADRYVRFHLLQLNEYKLWQLRIGQP